MDPALKRRETRNSDVLQYVLINKLNKKVRIDTEKNLMIIRIQRLLLAMISGLFVAGATWLIGSIFIARKAYARAVSIIDDARAKGVYKGPSGTRTAFAFHLGKAGAFLGGFANHNLPTALVIMCYEKQWTSVFAAQGIESWLQCVYKIGLENSELGAYQILCLALDCARGASQYGCPQNTLCPNVIDCLPKCNPTLYVQKDVGSITAMQGINGAFSGATAGAMMGIAATGPQGVVIALVSIILGSIFGGSLATAAAIEQSKQIHYQCVAMRQACVMEPGAPACGGFE